jgi:hypothetical protein
MLLNFDEIDVELSINAVNPNPLSLEELEIEIDQRKFDYLAKEKAQSLRSIGLYEGDQAKLKMMISEKLSSNYIYSMTYTEEHNTTQFNVVLEFLTPSMRPFRVLVALEYLPEAKRLRVIMF